MLHQEVMLKVQGNCLTQLEIKTYYVLLILWKKI